MVIMSNQIAFLLRPQRGVNVKVAPVVPAQKISKYNKNDRSMDEQKKNDVKTTAAILRIRKQGTD